MTNTSPTSLSSAAPDLLFSTPLSIVVRARAEYADGSHGGDIGLVVPRQHCVGKLPTQRALRIAARASLRRLHAGPQGRQQAVRRLLICVNEQWLPLPNSQPPAHAPGMVAS